MADITVPPKALEKAAKAAYEQWRFNMSCEFGLEITDYEPWDDLPEGRQNELMSEARAACIAMLRAWPGMEYMMGDEAFPFHYIILPLTENQNDKG